jgi:hypothetical protein
MNAESADFKIESVTFYRRTTLHSKGTENPGGTKMMAISLPRLKCLEENGEPYFPAWAVKRPIEVIEEKKAPGEEDAQEAKKRGVINRTRKFVKTPEVTEKEAKTAEMRQLGMSFASIGEAMGISRSAARDAAMRYAAKTGTKLV